VIREDLTYLMPKSLLVALVFVVSCTPKYYQYSGNYQFRDYGGPDYSNLDYWAAHPDKHDPSDSIPLSLQKESRDSSVDVFFIYPTTYTRNHGSESDNAPLDDQEINLKTDYTSILYQASVFNADCRIFAPRYRQVHLRMFFEKDSLRKQAAFDLAYRDIRLAFEYYLTHFNSGRPIIIASHSQGTVHAKRLIKQFFENDPLKSRLVCAYLVGMPVANDYFTEIAPCTDSAQTGCFVTWRTFRKGSSDKIYGVEENFKAIVTNPLTWSIDAEPAPASMNKGAVLYDFNRVWPNTNDAQIHGNVLWISKPRFAWGFLYFTRNYHAGDYNLFYLNIREDVRRRIENFLKR